ncbi:DNA alkylation repair protein [[Clostridium] polysaccharolyticum]|uniref:3-methyladenine DNA glycosylase AlkD n=1 Tax=[Clostridium] polysaccharolyticum TaxID=29364 RepID=A0A1H9Z9V6_9FIRM|nr:DNA alkylation repair protein [[Clostridium] polysaccharolyticum]SES78304.1 3-methyladenine DNA glycosylase AlkD [[Clostridium] polysaccharolyticum]
MEAKEIIQQLKEMSSDKFKQNVVRMGIPEENSIGVSTVMLRKMVPKIGRSNELAWDLWNTGYHEAKLLAVLLMEKKKVTLDDVRKMMTQVYSWDLCDHICKNLIIKIPGYQNLILEWCDNSNTYYRRAVFTLIASVSVHEKNVTEEEITSYLNLIKECSEDNREHVKKAVSWALREIGKIDYNYLERAIETAQELKERSSKACQWIAKDALKELETLVKVEGRTRLITSKSQMAKEQGLS